MATIAALQRQLEGVLQHPPAPAAAVAAVAARPAVRRFSAFHLDDVFQANVLASQWMRAAEASRAANGDMSDAVAAILAAAQQALEQAAAAGRDPELFRYALMLAMTHYRHGLPVRIPSLEARAPHAVLPSVMLTQVAAATQQNPEMRLAWYREDPKINEHHEHWHVVYPIAGIPAPDSPSGGQVKERQGELFLYMHHQMIARYETERLAIGLPPLVPWGYFETEPLGYDPGPNLSPIYGPRPPGKAWVDVPGETTVQDQATRGERLFTAATHGYFQLTDANGNLLLYPDGTPRTVPVDAHLLGTTQEADVGTVETNVLPFDPNNFNAWYESLVNGYYGNWHNVGHDLFAYVSTNQNGVMGSVPVAVRDHVFFRWHKLIDNLYNTWEETQPGNSFADAPPVVIRKSLPGQPGQPNDSPDIILCLKRQLVPWDDWQKFGTYAFGGSRWDQAFPAGTYRTPDLPTGFTTTDTLVTRMLRRVVTIETGREDPANPETPHEIEYLDQDEFFYFFRIENTSATPQDVTVRVFLVAADPTIAPNAPDDRRMWIELDKFKHSLAASEKAVIFRPAALSSVIRKPGVKPPTAEEPPVQAPADQSQEDALIRANYCDCGWPYNLLLPRGTRAGMRFRLLVMLTDWNIDHVPDDCDCGSMSYCGARDRYPDSRAMGYPFDRPFRDLSIADTIAKQPNMATRNVVIRWE